MRMPAIFISLFACALGTASLASTVTVTQILEHRTTDWTPYTDIQPGAPEHIQVHGSEIFEEYLGPGYPFEIPRLAGGATPDWIYLSHDLVMNVVSSAAAFTSGRFSVRLPGMGALIAQANYERPGGGAAQSTGRIAVPDSLFAMFIDTGYGWVPEFMISGGALATVIADYDDSTYYSPEAQSYDMWGDAYLDATLRGTISITAGFDGEPDPFTSLTPPASVPLPASGLLLGIVLLGGALVAVTGQTRLRSALQGPDLHAKATLKSLRECLHDFDHHRHLQRRPDTGAHA